MEQLYTLEIFIDSVTVRPTKEDASGSNKKLIIKLKFGPKVEFIIKENQVVPDDMIPPDEDEGNSWKRIIRIGKSYLFASYPDTMMSVLDKFPLELEVWTDDETETQIYIGLGTMKWDRLFYDLLTENNESDLLPPPLTMKQTAQLYAECCCGTCGEVTFILRLSCLGKTVVTEFQQLMKDPTTFALRTNRAPTTLECKRRGKDINFFMIGSIYETTTLEAPKEEGPTTVEVCTDVADSCCKSGKRSTAGGHYDDEVELKIRMGDITGNCGNPNCPLAVKIKQYIRKLDLYKNSIGNNQLMTNKQIKDKLVCGKCICKEERYHRDSCPTKTNETKSGICINCAGYVSQEKIRTCETENCKPNSNRTVMQCSINYFKDEKKSRGGCSVKDSLLLDDNEKLKLLYDNETGTNTIDQICSCCGISMNNNALVPPLNTALVPTDLSTYYVTEVTGFKDAVYKTNYQVYNCTTEPDDSTCQCEPVRPKPPCNSLDCTCIAKADAKLSRKLHKPFCPVYKHRTTCPINRLTSADEGPTKANEEDDDVEPLPYGLPPVKLGPCPVLGKPCTQPDGFAKMYKTAALPELPPSYNDAGKVCCSKEFERIKNAMAELMVNEKMNQCQTNCVTSFLQDKTEARCCDTDQGSTKLMGKSCCALHKLGAMEPKK